MSGQNQNVTAVTANEFQLRKFISQYMYSLHQLFRSFNLASVLQPVGVPRGPNGVLFVGPGETTNYTSINKSTTPYTLVTNQNVQPLSFDDPLEYKNLSTTGTPKLKWLHQVLEDNEKWNSFLQISKSGNSYSEDVKTNATNIYNWYREASKLREIAYIQVQQTGLTRYKFPIPTIYEYLHIKLGTYGYTPEAGAPAIKWRLKGDDIRSILMNETRIVKYFMTNPTEFKSVFVVDSKYTDPTNSSKTYSTAGYYDKIKDDFYTHNRDSQLHNFLFPDQDNMNPGAQQQFVPEVADKLYPAPLQTTVHLDPQKDNNAEDESEPLLTSNDLAPAQFRKENKQVAPATTATTEPTTKADTHTVKLNVAKRKAADRCESTVGIAQRQGHNSAKDKHVNKGEQKELTQAAQTLRVLSTAIDESGFKSWFNSVCGGVCPR